MQNNCGWRVLLSLHWCLCIPAQLFTHQIWACGPHLDPRYSCVHRLKSSWNAESLQKKTLMPVICPKGKSLMAFTAMQRKPNGKERAPLLAAAVCDCTFLCPGVDFLPRSLRFHVCWKEVQLYILCHQITTTAGFEDMLKMCCRLAPLVYALAPVI